MNKWRESNERRARCGGDKVAPNPPPLLSPERHLAAALPPARAQNLL